MVPWNLMCDMPGRIMEIQYSTVQATNMFTETLCLSSQYYASSKTQSNHHPGHKSTTNVEFQKCTMLATVKYYYY